MNTLLENVRTDDFVEYFIYPSIGSSCSNNKLSEIHNKISSFISSCTENYFWHKDEFNLNKILDAQSDDNFPHLHGVVYFGENIDDEWFIVHLIKKISENFDVVARIIDSDGEFLLIEAADYLPKWAKPDICDRRVYIHKGSVKIIPINILPKIKNIDEVITHLNNSNQVTETERNVTNCIDMRIKKYVDNPEDLLHRSRVYLPAKIAALLDAEPKLISAAVTAFFHRDIIDTRICRKMEHFPPDNLVLRLVTFTKFSYAMISQDKCISERNRWNLPPPSSPQYKEYFLGYKIASGFEILASKCVKKSQSDLTLNKKWNQYIQVLKRKGYFRDLIEQSKEYVELEKKARMYFLNNIGIEESSNDNILNILQTVNYDIEEMKRDEASLPASDDEKWMEIDEDQFNKLLEDRFGLKGVNVTNSPNALSSAINKFLNQMSDMEGIEIKHDKCSSQINEMDVDEDIINQNISFNPDNFMASVQQILDELNDGAPKSQNSNDDSNDDSGDNDDDDDYDSEDDAPEDPDMKLYMDSMDNEIRNSTLPKSFYPPDEKLLTSTDIDSNAMTNILKSYEEQFGGSGPAGNLLNSMGLKLDVKKSQ